MKLIIIMGLLLSGLVHAEDQWLCTDSDSERQGSSWYACGMSEAMKEEEARKEALDNAIREFYTICNLSSDCQGKDKTVEPKRTSCVHEKSGIVRCYRLIVVTILK